MATRRNPALAELRAEILKEQKRVGAKVARTKRVNKVDIAGTEYDPRKPVDRVMRMNTRQLRSYQASLDSFLNRRTQFYRGLGGKVWTGKQFRQVRAAELRANKELAKVEASIADLPTPYGITVGERMERKGYSRRSAMRERMSATNDPLRPRDHTTPQGLRNTSPATFQSLLAEASKRSVSGDAYFLSKAAEYKAVYLKMASSINETRLVEAVKGLSDRQFGILWTRTNFATVVSSAYETISKEFGSAEDELYNSEIEEALSNVALAEKNYPR